MIERQLRGDGAGHAHPRGDAFDPIAEGRRYGLTAAESLAIWQLVVHEAAHSQAGVRRWESERFHELAARAGERRPEIGKTTRVEAEARVARPDRLSRARIVPGKYTAVLMAAQHSLPSGATQIEPASSASRGDHAHGAPATSYRESIVPRVGGSAYAMATARTIALQDVLEARGRSARSLSLSAAVLATIPGTPLWKVTERRAASLYRRATAPGDVPAEASVVDDVLDRAGHGAALPIELQREMEQQLAVSLGRVRVHTDAVASEAARTLRAEAFTVGEDIYFAEGAFSPATRAGRKLIAHELAHVAQAMQGRTGHAGERRQVSQPGEPLEQEADAIADRIDRASADRAGVPAAMDPAQIAPGLDGPQSIPSTSLVTTGITTMFGRAGAASRSERVIHRKPAAATGSNAMWQQLFDGDSVEVGTLARVQAPLGVYLKTSPRPAATKLSPPIDFDGRVYVQRRTPQPNVAERWAYVVALDSGRAGFVEERFLAVGPPEPTAKLRPVTRQETLGQIAREVFKAQLASGGDERLYVQALYEANTGRAGIHLAPVNLGWTQSLPRAHAEQATLEVYLGVRILSGQAIWIPSEAFVRQLEASGAITSGSTELSKAARAAETYAHAVVVAAELQAGQIVGVLEGAYEAVRDIFKGAIDLLRLAFDVVKANLTGRLLELAIDAATKLKEFIVHLPDVATTLGAYIEKRWTTSGPFGKGEFVGEVVGYVVANVLLAMATGGGSLGAMLTEAAASGSEIARAVALLVKVTDAAANPLKLLETAGKGATIAEETAAKLKQALAHDGTATSKIGHDLNTAEHTAERTSAGQDRGIREATRGSDPPKRGPIIKSGVSEPPESVLRGGTLSERQLALDAKLEAAADKMIIIGKREVTATDLAALTRVSKVEHAIVILHDDTRALVRMGSYSGGSLPANTKRLLMHSHPGDWGTGMAKFISASDIEAIITLKQEYSYMVTLDGTVYKFTTKTMPMSIGEVVREFHPMHGWVGGR